MVSENDSSPRRQHYRLVLEKGSAGARETAGPYLRRLPDGETGIFPAASSPSDDCGASLSGRRKAMPAISTAEPSGV
jgi:hypothetical protein